MCEGSSQITSKAMEIASQVPVPMPFVASMSVKMSSQITSKARGVASQVPVPIPFVASLSVRGLLKLRLKPEKLRHRFLFLCRSLLRCV